MLSVGCLLLSGTATSAQITTVPSCLEPGDEYRLMFVTSTSRDATSAIMHEYNLFVRGVANSQPELAALSTQWYAVGGTATTSARTNTGIIASGDVPVFRLDGQMVVNDAYDLWNTQFQPLLNLVAIDETGALKTTFGAVFTGSYSDGTIGSLPLGATSVNFGAYTKLDTGWLRFGNNAATTQNRFYAVSDPLTVPAGGGSTPIELELDGNLAPSGTHQSGPFLSVEGSFWAGVDLSRAASFSPAQDGTLETVEVALLRGPLTDDVRVELRADASGAPGALIEDLGIHSGFLPWGTTTSGQSSFASAQKPTLLAGTTYWIVCSPEDPNTFVHWALNDKGEQGQSATQAGGGSWTVQTGTAPAFEVSGIPDEAVPYCTAGVSASGCQATLSAPAAACASLNAGFFVVATNVEGDKDGVFFYGTNGRQANAWGNGTSYHCVIPPVKRGGMLDGTGTAGLCDGSFSQDLTAHWNANPQKNPGGGAVVQAQLWYRDPFSTSNQTTSLSDAIEFAILP
jgi:hypothetical protein